MSKCNKIQKLDTPWNFMKIDPPFLLWPNLMYGRLLKLLKIFPKSLYKVHVIARVCGTFFYSRQAPFIFADMQPISFSRNKEKEKIIWLSSGRENCKYIIEWYEWNGRKFSIFFEVEGRGKVGIYIRDTFLDSVLWLLALLKLM